MLTGGCLCGATRYEAGGTPYNATNCHCGSCRRAAGAAVVAWFTVKRADFSFIGAPPAAYRSSEPVLRRFCATCGSTLTYETERHPDEVDVTTCSLDDPDAVPPRDQVFTAARVAWVSLEPGLPVHAAGRPPPAG